MLDGITLVSLMFSLSVSIISIIVKVSSVVRVGSLTNRLKPFRDKIDLNARLSVEHNSHYSLPQQLLIWLMIAVWY